MSSPSRNPNEFQTENPLRGPKLQLPTPVQTKNQQANENRRRTQRKKSANAFRRAQLVQQISVKKRPDKFTKTVETLDPQLDELKTIIDKLYKYFQSKFHNDLKSSEYENIIVEVPSLLKSIQDKLQSLDDIITDLPDSDNERQKDSLFLEKKGTFTKYSKDIEGLSNIILYEIENNSLKNSTDELREINTDLIINAPKKKENDILFESDAQKLLAPYVEKQKQNIEEANKAIKNLEDTLPKIKEYTKNFSVDIPTRNQSTLSEKDIRLYYESTLKNYVNGYATSLPNDIKRLEDAEYRLDARIKELIEDLTTFDIDGDNLSYFFEIGLEDSGNLLFNTDSELESKLEKKKEKKIFLQKRLILTLRQILNKQIDTPFENPDDTLKTLVNELIQDHKTYILKVQDLVDRIEKSSSETEKDELSLERQQLLDEYNKRNNKYRSLCRFPKLIEKINKSLSILEKRVVNKDETQQEYKQEITKLYEGAFDKGFQKESDEYEPPIYFPKIGDIYPKTPFGRLLVDIQNKIKDDTDESKAYAELYAKLFVYMYLLMRGQVSYKVSLNTLPSLFYNVDTQPSFSRIFSDENIAKLEKIIPKLKDLEPMIEKAYFRLKLKSATNPVYKERLLDSKEFLTKLPRIREVLDETASKKK